MGSMAVHPQAQTVRKMLDPVSAANTAAATSGWIDCRAYEGDLTIEAAIGAMTGSITWTLEDATDSSGTGGAGITPVEGAFTAGAANLTQKRTIGAQQHRGWMRIVGTIVTGPSLVQASISGQLKNQ